MVETDIISSDDAIPMGKVYLGPPCGHQFGDKARHDGVDLIQREYFSDPRMRYTFIRLWVVDSKKAHTYLFPSRILHDRTV